MQMVPFQFLWYLFTSSGLLISLVAYRRDHSPRRDKHRPVALLVLDSFTPCIDWDQRFQSVDRLLGFLQRHDRIQKRKVHLHGMG